ncbi:hypothetical protein IB633_08670 [Francisella philomiragia]|uniref:Uncharacterized protein n=1 Tax=Francisella philomiragia subsp. philomiragia (strain ATCC 25017 / CCUG 19701 / FSC 153 / O\|nr:hypothetical protein [Francisella philomiragia]AJI47737.1 hypothetical protein BF30_362 [Francisella philomiragia]AJI50060.1 hypothetical protein KU46_1192 [Francisella philomiragia]MBK2020611.1 hypothetical protein [Francisella philomiragia]MBK2031125.1 hypothetical protein [Francisella philomiragia]MBK2264863.1 hypothetical protein [Francisella philomiragia]
MIFDEMMTDTVFIEDLDGNRSKTLKTRFGGDKITIFDGSIDIDDNYTVIQTLPNGKEIRYIITDYQFNNRFHDINEHYVINIEKETKHKSKTSQKPLHTYNINNSNIQFGDGNTQNIINFFEDMVEKIQSSDSTELEKKEAKNLLKSFISNPIIASILGGATSAIIGLL